MTATNHAITGSVIVALAAHPAVGLPLALLSHFALDSVPHFGAHTVAAVDSKDFRNILMTDAFLCASFLVLVTFAGVRMGYSWWLLPLGGILAALPDVMWLDHYRKDLKGQDKEWGIIRKFHKSIQRWERSWGWSVELVWFVLMLATLNHILFH